MLKITPKEDLKPMTMEEVDKMYHGLVIVFDMTEFYPEDMGYVLAVADNGREADDFIMRIPNQIEGYIFTRGANRERWAPGYVQEVYLW